MAWKPEKRKRDVFLYMAPRGDREQFAQCGTCAYFMPGAEKCAPMEGHRVTAEMSCGCYAHGEPTDDQRITNSFTAAEAGLVNRRVRCENCASFAGPDHCELFARLNRDHPDIWDLEVTVDTYGCCNAQVPAEGA